MIKKTIKEEKIYPVGFLNSDKKSFIFCRSEENPKKIFLISNKGKSSIVFSKIRKNITIDSGTGKNIKLEKIDSIVSSKIGKKELIAFTYKTGKTKKLIIAISRGVNKWSVISDNLSIKERGGIVSELSGGKYALYYGESSINLAFSGDLKKWGKAKEPILKSRPGFFDNGNLKFVASKPCEKGILVFYDASVRADQHIKLQIGAALISPLDPKKVIWRSDFPIFEKKIKYESDLKCIGVLFFGDTVSIYWHSQKEGTISSSMLIPFSRPSILKPFDKIKKNKNNPIIGPKPESWWSSAATLNPTAVNIDGTIHLLFRAMGKDGISRIGYAKTKDGIHIDEIYPNPVFALEYSKFGLRPVEKRFDPVMYPSGGSWGGCEDQRMVRIDDRIYVTFNAFDNWDNIRVGMISISVQDFLNKVWKWSEMKFISPIGRHKNWVLFPEKINGKYAILHNLHADEADHVLIEYVENIDSLNTENVDFESPDPQAMPNKQIAWHIRMRSIGPAPVKTKDGWLVLYHAHDAEIGRYKIGAILLDLNDPTKIIARLSIPILTPDMWYENDWKPGIVYACGAVVKNEKLFIYYGGGDKYVCVATVPLNILLESLKNDMAVVPTINKVIIS